MEVTLLSNPHWAPRLEEDLSNRAVASTERSCPEGHPPFASAIGLIPAVLGWAPDLIPVWRGALLPGVDRPRKTGVGDGARSSPIDLEGVWSGCSTSRFGGVVGVYYFGFLALGLATATRRFYYRCSWGALSLSPLGLRRHSPIWCCGACTLGALHMAGGMIPVSGDRVSTTSGCCHSFASTTGPRHRIRFCRQAFWESVRHTVDRTVPRGRL